jgi:hypothetical protein
MPGPSIDSTIDSTIDPTIDPPIDPSERLPMIDLHYWPTPNGKKVTILLEELGMPYRIVPCNIGRGDQFTDGFLKIEPRTTACPRWWTTSPSAAAPRSACSNRVRSCCTWPRRRAVSIPRTFAAATRSTSG